MTLPESRLEKVLERDRLLVMAGIAALAILCWAWLIQMAWAGMDMSSLAEPRSWGLAELVLLGLMWVVMMIAMMVPSAAPMILLFARVNRQRRAQQRPYVPTAVFVLGYLSIWTLYSVAATLAQWGLHQAALLSPAMVSSSPLLGGGLLIAAGIFQWLPLKDACLVQCRSPLGFLTTFWRERRFGAFLMGVRHGVYCLGCCWILMALLFVAGVMNLLWIALLTAFVLVEKAAPRGRLVGRIGGVVLVLSGLALLLWSH